jgi:flagellar basal body-associated protein FliL
MEQLAIIIAIVAAVATVVAFVVALWLHRDNKRRFEQRKARTSATPVAAEEFQANCMKLLDEVASSGKPLVIN